MIIDLKTTWASLPEFSQWLIATLATIFLGALIQRIFFREKPTYSIKQSQQSGDNSQPIQVGVISKGDKDD